MQTHRGLVAVACALLLTSAVRAQQIAREAPESPSAGLGTAFTYQGQLFDAGSPASGSYDLQLRLLDAASGGSQVGSTVTKDNVMVTNGLFTADLDFGASVWIGQPLWLEVGVRPGSSTGAFTVLSPRQQLNPAPFAHYSKAGIATDVQCASCVSVSDLAGGAASSGQVLTATGASSMAWQSPTSLGGSGSAGQVAFWSGASALSGSSNLFWDNGNGRLGIGTTSPSAQLALTGNLALPATSAGAGQLSLGGLSFLHAFGTNSTFLGSLAGNTSLTGSGNTFSSWYPGVYGGGPGDGVLGEGAFGVRGHAGSDGAVGVRGEDFYQTVYGELGGTVGVKGVNPSTATGAVAVLGQLSTTSAGDGSAAVKGMNQGTGSSGVGVWGEHAGGGWGVYGASASGDAVHGSTTSGNGVYGVAWGAGWAGYFQGDANVTGTLYKGGGAFLIDHSLAPERMLLAHSFVESPDMLNVYNGNAVLDERGEAVVELPAYFEALNRDFRYQLTCVGAFAPVFVADEIAGNQFRIAGGTSGLKVSWQVTGVRKDPWAEAHRIVVEQDKPEAGRFVHPEIYGQPEETRILPVSLHPLR